MSPRSAPRRRQRDLYLDGQLLVAMPAMGDPRFARSVIYLCAHSADGAMGIIINQRAPNISFTELLEQLNIVPPQDRIRLPSGLTAMAVHLGGPVETGRGFVLHSADYFKAESTLPIDESVCLTATIDILRDIAKGTGPDKALLALGYAGWAPGQLENEIQNNGWLNCPADPRDHFRSRRRSQIYKGARQDRHRSDPARQRLRTRLIRDGGCYAVPGRGSAGTGEPPPTLASNP
jgi:putative transcriptional regulator